MKLILLRHGESQVNAGNKKAGENNLTAKGRRQMAVAVKQLVGQKIEAIYCSPTLRCQESMEEILRGRGREIQVCFSKLLKPKLKEESLEELKARIEMFYDDLLVEFEGEETVLVVGHRMPLKMFVYQLTGKNVDIANAAVSVFEIKDNKITAIAVNEAVEPN